jgi:alcohol dehydrogenase YqhD (iron-dependent ADH family)
MKDFIYYAPTEVVLFGKSSEEHVAHMVKKYGW